MKKIFAALLALASSVAFATTTVPVQLLNPTGSSSGQAIVSTGASSAPAWGGIGVNGIAAIAANTVLSNATASSASPTAFAMPSCSTSASALNWTTSTGFTCNSAVNAAMLGGATFASPGAIGSTTPGAGSFTTISATGAITPSQTLGIVGTTTNNNANAGVVGEYGAQTANTSISTATNTNLTSISLTAGDWDVTGAVVYVPAGGASVTNLVAGASSTSATLPGVPAYGQFPSAVTSNINIIVPTQRFSLASTTTIYLVGQVTFSVGTVTYNALLRARRVR